MNAKHLFLTLTMLLASFTFAVATPVTDNITLSNMLSAYSPSAMSHFNVSNYSPASGSGAKFSGRLYYYYDADWEDTPMLEYLTPGDDRLVSTTSGGELKKVSIAWDNTDGYLSGASCIYVFARKNVAFNGTETYTSLLSDGKSTLVATLTYPAYETSDLAGLGYTHVAIVGNAAYHSSLSIQWTPSEKYNISIDGGFVGADGLVKVNRIKGTAGAVVTTAEAGELVELIVKPKPTKCVTKYSFGDMIFDLECRGYIEGASNESDTISVYMPANDVVVSVTFAPMPSKETNIVTFDDGGDPTVGSGATKTFGFQLKYFNGVGTTDDIYYTGEVTCTSSDASALTIVDYDVNMSTGKGSVSVTGLIGPSANIQVNISKTTNMFASVSELPISVTPRQAALIAKYGDEYYAMLNDVNSEGHASAERIYKGSDSKYYYDPTSGTSLLDMTWNIMNEDVDGDQFTIQHPTTEEFLTLPSTKLKFSDASFSWVRDDGFLIGATGLSYNPTYKGSDFGSIRYDFTYGVYDVIIGENFIPFETYSTNSAASINDPRTLTPGNYGTFCSPYDVPSVAGVGAKFFTLEGKVVDGANLAGIVISDPVDELIAGHAYLYQVDEGASAINLERCMRHLTKASTSTEDGFVGCLADDGDAAGKVYATSGVTPRSDGDYMLKDNKLHYVPTGSKGSVKPYRAFIRAKELTEVKAGSVPKRRIVIVDGFTGEIGSEDSETSVDELVDSSELNWDKPVYNIMGVRVSKGATGVLIQNGHKFFVK